MPKELTFNIKTNSNLSALIKELKDLKTGVDNVNKSSGGGGLPSRMTSAAEKAKLRTQAAAIRIPGVYGKGGAEEYSGYRPTSAKSKSGGLAEALGIGAIAGGAAGGVMLLVNALKDMAGESQILSKFFGTVGKLLGTLIDLVLLPFLPILVWAMMWLATNVMKFGNFWSEFITTLKEKGILGLLKLSLTTDETGIIGWTKALLLYLFGTEEEKKKALALLFKWNLEITDWATKWGEVILGFFFGTEADKKKSLIATLGLEKGVLNGIGEILFGPILDFFFGSEDKAVIKKTIGAWLDINLGAVTDVLLGIISPFLQFAFGGDKTVEKKLVLSVDFLVGAGQWLVDLMLNLASLGMIKGWDWGKTPMGVSGGGGSSYTPKELPASINSQSRGGNTFIFQGYQDDKFIAKVKDVLRSEGTRYTQ